MPRGPLYPLLVPLLSLAAVFYPAPASLYAQGRVDLVPGVVRAEDGTAVKGATVVSENAKAKPHLFATTTDGDGNFYFSGLTAGTWTFTVTAPGYIPVQQTIVLPKGRTVPAVQVSMRKGEWQPPPPLRDGRLAGVDLFRLQTDLENADTFMRAGHYDQAIAAYREVLAKAPALTRAHLAIGDAYRMKNDFDNAEAAYREVLAAEPNSETAVLGFAAVEVGRGALERADTLLSEAASRIRAGREIPCALGDVKLARQQAAAAEDWYRKAAAADPAWARPQLKLGLLAASRGDASAVGFLEKAISLQPGSPEAAEAARALAALRK